MKRKRDERRTYTKKAVKALLIVGVLNAEIPYLLAYLGREPCTELVQSLLRNKRTREE